MAATLKLALKVLAVILGLAFIVMSLLLYPNEEGQIESRLGTLWENLRKKQTAALSLHIAFMQGVAEGAIQIFDRLFGAKLFSRRALGVSICYSAASVGIVGMFLSLAESSEIYWSGTFVGGAFFVFFIALGTIPAIVPGFRYLWTWLLLVLSASFVLLMMFFSDGDPRPGTRLFIGLSSALAMAASFTSDILFIALTRRCLRWITQANRFIWIAAVLLLNCLLATCLMGLPIFWSGRAMADEILGSALAGGGPVSGTFPVSLPDEVFIISASNTIDALSASLFFMLAILLLVHLIFWPVLNRTLFRVKEIGIRGRRGLLLAIGIALLAISHELPDWLKEVFKSLSSG
ncbi:MAG TPA: hypothetical protein VGG04_07670 [Candidatus Sulfotelmatobacter sp.]|jgi:hypothetical protein